MNEVGYRLRRTGDDLDGYLGLFYDYILASNGVFIQAQNDLMIGRVPAAIGQIRGLHPVEPVVYLKHGLIPANLVNLVIDAMLASPTTEAYIGIRWHEGQYRLYMPEQTRQAAKVEYLHGENIILDLHSHPNMPARFSKQDNDDEQGLRLYGVVGIQDGIPELRIRLGVYGYWMDVDPMMICYGIEGGLLLLARRPAEEDEVDL